MKNALIAAAIVLMTGCTTVTYNGTDIFVEEISHPEVGKVITAYVGDHMVQKGTITEESVLLVQKQLTALYTTYRPKNILKSVMTKSKIFTRLPG